MLTTRKKWITKFIGLVLIGLSYNTFSQTFNLEKGQSRLIKSDQKIDTVFVSSPNVADYEILDDHSFMIYTKEEGKSEVVAFDEQGNQIKSDTINVNDALNNIADTNRQIKARFPNSKLSVKKVGKAYIIEGEAISENERDEINRIVGASLGSSPKVTEYKLQHATGGDDKVSFLDKYSYDDVINNSQVADNVQINVKLTVVEVNKKFSDALGINWNNLHGNLLNNLGKSFSGSGGFNGTNGGTLSLNADGLSIFINALDNQNNGKILAEPNVSMLSGETADILVGGELPFAQRDRDGNPTIIYKDFGIKLGVGAKLQKDNRIRLALAQEVSTLAGNYQYDGIGAIPFFNTRRSKSTFEIADGESFIIGGLLSQDDIEGLSKIPVLGDIPILGSFFRSASTQRESRELVIVATVNLVKAVNSEQIVYPTFEQTGTMERFFHVTPLKKVYHQTLITNFLKDGGFIQ
ncbi:type II and III secretion system protein family protein [Lonepinella koalarum]|uniref:Pilus assembly protein CpaC n=1 Tax=Lonepinella koalarum TaxID=53417 RepID=A0A4R1KX98_9PAST|nr:type II and III secretion system protein family protein [Lonepinella koalarum]MDH2927802.1 secretin [Lonepinella koalarum]TCK69995.1 pilus assembly protein CpaC [Lonepinella koalarum]TFJ90402.1 type II and III secretion system protein family protein [Lonepinella koalarum]TYG35099.1 type II and III secretion system protein family protein [Lonepinella koalarum]